MHQCEFVLLASDSIDESIKRSDVRGTFYASQNLLTAAANISKALWGGKERSVARKILRDRIGISDASPIREVDMRNNYEHFDERLERWWKAFSQPRSFADLSIVETNDDLIMLGVEIEDRFRMLNLSTMTFTFWGQEFPLRDLVEEVRKVLPTVRMECTR